MMLRWKGIPEFGDCVEKAAICVTSEDERVDPAGLTVIKECMYGG